MRESVSPRDARPAECASRSLTSSAPAAAGPPGPPACPACSAPLPPPPPQSQLGTAPSPPHRRTWPPWPVSTVPPHGACAPVPGHAPTVTPPPRFRAGPRPSALELPVRGGAPAPELEGAEAGSEGLLPGGLDPPGAAVGFPRLQTHGPTAPRMEGGQTTSGVETAQRIQRTGVRTLGCAFNGHLKEYTVFSILMTFH